MSEITRRDLIAAGSAALAAGAVTEAVAQTPGSGSGGTPCVISSINGLRVVTKAMEMIRAGADVLDAVIAGVNILEDDPEENGVGYGGLPNEDGDVELDASVMHGPTRRAGAIGAIQKIKNPSKVAKLVMERTDHLMLVGPGALRFAVAHGFEPMNLLTDKSRIAWLYWKEHHGKTFWGPGLADGAEAKKAEFTYPGATPEIMAFAREMLRHPLTGTVNCLGVDAQGNLSGTTTTSGMAYKLAGRVGDSPIIGAGLWLDNDIGAGGSTGRGEENIKIAGAHTVVELMRNGAKPVDACLETLKRVRRNYFDNRAKLEKVDLDLYALNKNGEYGSASLWNLREDGQHKPRFAVCDAKGPRLMDCAYLMQR
jgi:N4-(beta-N-acetylglucosaminyl)-L-asparaginase